MQKEEIFALLDQLLIDQTKYNKFREYLYTFTKEPRCKKGCLAFIEEIFNLPNVAGKNELAMTLTSCKSDVNSCKVLSFIDMHPVTNGYNDALKDARCLIMGKIAEYIKDTSVRLNETTLADRNERQVYLRRAVARLKTIFGSGHKTTVLEDQWPEVEPYEWCDYLTTSLDELLEGISSEQQIKQWSDVYGDVRYLDKEHIICSLRTYLNYLDSFLKF